MFRAAVVCLALVGLAGCRSAPEPQPLPPYREDVVALDDSLKRPDVIAVSKPLPGFGRGINLGNCFDAPSEGAWGTRISATHFEMAAAAGLDHVRLPVRFTTAERMLSEPPFTIKEELFKKVDWAIDQALARNLSIIVTVSNYDAIHQEPAAHKERLYAIWRQVAKRYAGRPEKVAFEILSEPNSKLDPTLLNEITAEAIRIIRKDNPKRIIMADPYYWSASDFLGSLKLPADDPNVVGEFHMYQPALFTHQGADWMDPWYRTVGVVFPGPPSKPIEPDPATLSQPWVIKFFEEYNQKPIEWNPSGPMTVFAHFDNAARWVRQTGKRVYLGEFGAIDFADRRSRENYVWLVRTEAERRGIGWAYWDDGSKFRAMNVKTRTWHEGLRRALLE